MMTPRNAARDDDGGEEWPDAGGADDADDAMMARWRTPMRTR